MGKSNWVFIIWNIICIIWWAVLAIIFDIWGLALFSIFFMISFKNYYYRVCDKCGKHSPIAKNYNEALEKAKKCGWISKKIGDKWEDYCPDCQKED